jgi:hypothetical protein
VYHSFSTTAGDSLNNLFDPNARAFVAHPALAADAQLRPGGEPDLRFTTKTAVISPAKTSQGLTSDRAMNVYTGPAAAVPIIRNEELLLLRAEANIQQNNLGAALDDINAVRQVSGGLAPLAGFADQAAALTELLYNRRYSLLFEGHRWIDLRRYNLLNTLSSDATALGPAKRFSKFPFPVNDCLARETPPASGCSPEAGF